MLSIGFDVRRFTWSRLPELEWHRDGDGWPRLRIAWTDFTEVIGPFEYVHLRAGDASSEHRLGPTTGSGTPMDAVRRGTPFRPFQLVDATDATMHELREVCWFIEGATKQALENQDWTAEELAMLADVLPQELEETIENLRASHPRNDRR